MSLIDLNGINNYIKAFEEFIFQNFSLISLLTGLLLLINNTLFIKKDLDKKKNVVKNKKFYALNIAGIVLLCVFLISHCISPYLPASYKNIKPRRKTLAPVKPRIASPLRSTPPPVTKPMPSPSRPPSPSPSRPLSPSPSRPPSPSPKKFDFFEWLNPKPKQSSEPSPKPRLPSPPRPNADSIGNIETPRPTIPTRELIENIGTETGSDGERLRIAARENPDIRRQLQLARLTPEQPRQPVSKPLQLTDGNFSQINPIVRPPLLQKTLPVPPLVQPKVPSELPRVSQPDVSAPIKGPRYGPDGKRIFANPYYGTGIGRGPGAPKIP